MSTRQRIPLVHPWVVLLLGLLWLVAIAVVARGVWHLSHTPGGLEGAIASTPGRRGNWIGGVITAASLPTALLCWFLLRSLHTLVLADDGVALKRLGRTLWFLPRAEYAGWRWHETSKGQTLALELVSVSGNVRRIMTAAGMYPELLRAVQNWAPERDGLPSQIMPAASEWKLGLRTATVAWIVLVFLFAAAMNWGNGRRPTDWPGIGWFALISLVPLFIAVLFGALLQWFSRRF